MFSLFNGIYDSYLAPTQLNLLIVGAPNVGKTSLLERLKVTEIPTRPTAKGGGGGKSTSSRNVHVQTVQQSLGAEELTLILHNAFVETGAKDMTNRRKSSVAAKTGSNDAPGIDNRKVSANKSETTQKKKRFSFSLNICPAPERYLKSAQHQDEDFVEDHHDIIDEEHKNLLSGNNERGRKESRESEGDPPRRVRCHSKEFDVDSLDLMDGRRSSMEEIPLGSSTAIECNKQKSSKTGSDSSNVTGDQSGRSSRRQSVQLLPTVQGPPLLQTSQEEYNIKPKSKMLPLKMIRPTIGTNLGKLDMFGAKCHIFDVGGRLQDLWERYYDDCDAVIFCWKLGEDPDKPPRDEHDSNDENDNPQNIYKQQQKMLNEVRENIPDDVPFLIFGHIFGNANIEAADRMYSTDLLLPRYHNPMTGLCCGSAKNGAGVQSAMEWLIPLAKRQQKERLAAKRNLEEKAL